MRTVARRSQRSDDGMTPGFRRKTHPELFVLHSQKTTNVVDPERGLLHRSKMAAARIIRPMYDVIADFGRRPRVRVGGASDSILAAREVSATGRHRYLPGREIGQKTLEE